LLYKAIREVLENEEELKLNGTYQLVYFDDGDTLLGKNMRNVEKKMLY
jgi:hypothetical protein